MDLCTLSRSFDIIADDATAALIRIGDNPRPEDGAKVGSLSVLAGAAVAYSGQAKLLERALATLIKQHEREIGQ